jgi:glycosyltransferase involved in cell wall biosynthesis
MRVLYVTNSVAVGGVETNLVGLGEELQRRGHRVMVASSGGSLEGELAARGITHFRLPISLRGPGKLLLAAVHLRTLIERGHYDVVHVMSAAGNLATLLAHRGGRPVYVSSPMGLQQSDRESAFVTDLRNRFMVWRTDRVLLISEEIASAVRRLRIASDRLEMANVVGVDIRRFEAEPTAGAAVRQALGVDEQDELVSTIGALHSRKRHDLFVAAAPRVLVARPRARFLIVGEGPERAALTRQLTTLGIADRVTLAGQRHDISAILAATDVYVRPGIVEGFIGITVMEAMAARRPVISWAANDVRPAITDGETGILVPIADVDALADAIVRLLRDRALADAIARRGRARVEERFSLPAIAAELEGRYAQVLRGR